MERKVLVMSIPFVCGGALMAVLGAAASSSPDSATAAVGRYQMVVDEASIYILDCETSALYCRVKKLFPFGVVRLGTVQKPEFGMAMYPESRSRPRIEILTFYEMLIAADHTHESASSWAATWAKAQMGVWDKIAEISGPGSKGEAAGRAMRDAYKDSIASITGNKALAEIMASTSQSEPNRPSF